jgi:hypothetical protein
MIWHTSNDAIPSQRWLRDTIVRLRKSDLRSPTDGSEA